MGKTTEEFVETYLKNEMILAIGTSYLGEKFLKKLAMALEESNKKILIMPTSTNSAIIAKSLGFEIASINKNEVDVAIEFASQCDKDFNFIKNDSTSLVRDKMIAQSAELMFAVCEEKNYVKQLNGVIAFEIAAFGWERTVNQLDQLGKAEIRKFGKEFIKSETGNYLVDVKIDSIHDLNEIDAEAKNIPGVLETGIFIGFADKLVLIEGEKVIKIKSRVKSN
ncbi:MAG: ribose-5-phosphate isomerase A [Candidatus Diapherotrites archaeon]|nr:ribose-5-phosphate isomerase A [Candidatus Diapherotrites archaeon]